VLAEECPGLLRQEFTELNFFVQPSRKGRVEGVPEVCCKDRDAFKTFKADQ
jgi:hypothetical protein